MTDTQSKPKDSYLPMLILSALSLSIGWGIRGDFGHQQGAMIPGALAAMAAVILSGREDWLRRVGFFGLFGAIGWSFGGSISYMKVIAYTQCGVGPVMLYGYACLFLIGFMWAAMGGAGTALPAFMSRERLTELIAPAIAYFSVLSIWDLNYDRLNLWLQGVIGRHHLFPLYQFRVDEPLYLRDAEWSGAVIAILVPLVYCAIRRKWDRGSSLIFHLGVGWVVSFLVLAMCFDLRMTSPRSDDWAGIVGVVIAMWIWMRRNGLPQVTTASLIAGFIGGAGFAGAAALKLLEVDRGVDTNWHSVLEQTYGMINGIGIGVMMIYLMKRAPRMSDDPPVRRWTDWFAPAATLLLVHYLNARQDPAEWVGAKAMADHLYYFQPITWFNIWYLALTATVITILVTHMRRPLAIFPRSWMGKGQLLYIALLWMVVVMDFEKAVVGFGDQRLITEGTIAVNALVCTMMVLLCAWRRREAPAEAYQRWSVDMRRWASGGALASVVFICFCLESSLVSMAQIPKSFNPTDVRFQNPPLYLFIGTWVREDGLAQLVFVPGGTGSMGVAAPGTTTPGWPPPGWSKMTQEEQAKQAPPVLPMVMRPFHWHLRSRWTIDVKFDGETKWRVWPYAADNANRLLDIITTGRSAPNWERFHRIGRPPQSF